MSSAVGASPCCNLCASSVLASKAVPQRSAASISVSLVMSAPPGNGCVAASIVSPVRAGTPVVSSRALTCGAVSLGLRAGRFSSRQGLVVCAVVHAGSLFFLPKKGITTRYDEIATRRNAPRFPRCPA